uniref:Transmembrane protein n=1 Tax=Panagrellus redivivus TaxID=6233 RepID=A0A7E4UV71_PANRE
MDKINLTQNVFRIHEIVCPVRGMDSMEVELVGTVEVEVVTPVRGMDSTVVASVCTVEVEEPKMRRWRSSWFLFYRGLGRCFIGGIAILVLPLHDKTKWNQW